ncbi:MAG: nucleotide exchange factor GrpE [Betaproteobacteria bacterium]|nr:nucleotide exchange factor GrpE [Betaproteobacteria bacterium]
MKVQTMLTRSRQSEGTNGPDTRLTPWWRHPMVWLVISGPAVVVVAGFFTLWLAIGHPDPVVIETLRIGYRWKGRVLRPAMVKVQG